MIDDSLAARLSRTAGWKIACLLAALGFLLVLPSLSMGLASLDDFDQQQFVRAKLQGSSAVADRPWYDVYNLVNGVTRDALNARNQWLRPWWSVPELKVRFLRPVAAALLFADRGLFADHFWLAHLHSALWYFAACFSVALLVLRLSRDRWVAVLGGLLFVVDDAHGNPVSWLAGRNAIVAVTLVCIALLLFDTACRFSRTRLFFAASLVLLLALLAAENVLSAVPMFVAYALFLDKRKISNRVLAVLPILAVVFVWYAGRKALGFGTYGSGAYLDPLRDASAYWQALPDRYVRLLRSHFSAPWSLATILPIPWLAFTEDLQWWILFPAVLLFVIRNIDRSDELAFWTVSAAVGLVPLTAASPHQRLLTHVGIALWMVIAHFLIAMGRRVATLRGRLRLIAIGTIALPACIHLILAPIALAFESSPVTASDSIVPSIARDPDSARRQLVLLNVPDSLRPLSMTSAHLRNHLPIPARTTVLGSTPHEVEVTRLDAHTFELYTPPGYLLDEFANFWRGPTLPMHQGDRVTVQEYTVLIVRVTPDGRPLRVRFRFERALEDPALRFMYWTRGTFADFPFGPIGQRRIIAAEFDHTNQLSEELVR
jgi:hypothetical protein